MISRSIEVGSPNELNKNLRFSPLSSWRWPFSSFGSFKGKMSIYSSLQISDRSTIGEFFKVHILTLPSNFFLAKTAAKLENWGWNKYGCSSFLATEMF